MTDSEKPAPKIIIDEDYKTQVAAEKEALRKKEQQSGDSPEAPASEAPAREAPASEAPANEAPQGSRIPPASFSMLVSSLATQALAALGQIPGADGKTGTADKELAKHFIDTLALLEDKTKGNLTEAEAATLNNVLHELRMLFVALG